jgi:GTP-binding protein
VAKVTRLRERPRGDLVVERVASGFVVRGESVEQLVERSNLDSETGLGRFQSQLDRLGVSAALEAAGVMPGDTVRIAGTEFEYQP